MSSTFVVRAVTVSVAAAVLIVVGCFTTSQFGHAPFRQKGEVNVASGAEKEIIFPTAYASAPDITVEDDWLNNLKVVERKADRFRVRNESYQTVRVTWTATGERAPSPSDPPPANKVQPNPSRGTTAP